MQSSKDKNIKTYKIGNVDCEATLGDGSCAFNAFILAFTNKEVIEQLENENSIGTLNDDFRQFINAASNAFKMCKIDVAPDWTSVTTAMLDLRKNQPVLLQQILAPIMREIALKDAENDKEYLDSSTELVGPAFEDLLTREFGLPSKGIAHDDILGNHGFFVRKCLDFIVAKFPEYQKLTPEDKKKIKTALSGNEAKVNELKEEIDKWWKKEGFKEFCKSMRNTKPPVQWGGEYRIKTISEIL